MKLSSAYDNLGAVERSVGVMRTFGDIRDHPLRYFSQSWPGVHQELTAYLTWPVIVLALVGLGLGLWRRTRFTALVAVWALAQLGAAIWLAGNVYARYLVPAIPFVLLLAAIGVNELVALVRARGGERRRRTLAVCAAVGALLLVAGPDLRRAALVRPRERLVSAAGQDGARHGLAVRFRCRAARRRARRSSRPTIRSCSSRIRTTTRIQVIVLASERHLQIDWRSPDDAGANDAQGVPIRRQPACRPASASSARCGATTARTTARRSSLYVREKG